MTKSRKPAARKPRPLRYSTLGLLTQNPSFDFLREEPDLYLDTHRFAA